MMRVILVGLRVLPLAAGILLSARAVPARGKPGNGYSFPLGIPDSLPGTPAVVPASPFSRLYVPGTGRGEFGTWLRQSLDANRFFLNTGSPEYQLDQIRPVKEVNGLFYLLAASLLLLGLIRLAFYKYFSDLFRAFFNPSMSTRPLRDQLVQTPLPSLLLNAYFCLTLGIYLLLILRNSGYIVSYHLYTAIPFLSLLLGLVYLVKFGFLRISGWLFGARGLVDSYIFILYLVQKVTGILILPFLLVMAFASPALARAALYLSLAVLGLMFAYRYIRSYAQVRNYLTFSRFHFFLYLCAFEIAPVMVLAKVVLVWFNGAP